MSLRVYLNWRLGCVFRGLRTLQIRTLSETSSNYLHDAVNGQQQSFEDMGLHSILRDGLIKGGKKLPTTVQKVAFQPIVNGSDVVIAAETGMSFTHFQRAAIQ
jgi:superfamily II DNA/RNA helicase